MFLQRSTTRSVAIVATAALLGAIASPGEAATTTCSTVAACVFGVNTSSGIGVEGKSSSGYGVSGISGSGHGVDGTSSTSFGVAGRTTMNATSSANARAGVLGTDASTNKNPYNSGVAGTSPYGIGVLGSSTNGYGVYGSSGGGGTGVEASSNTGTAISAAAYGQGAAVFVSAGNEGMDIELGNNPSGSAIHAYANPGPGDPYTSPGNILIGTATLGPSNHQYVGDVVSIDGYGDEILAGSLTQNGTPLSRTHTAAGQTVATFGTRTATPSIEDSGEANLVNGQGYVRLDPTFASAIDRTWKYLVFVTPQGQSNGLYVTQITSTGFAVRENAPGRSSIAFDYRIVARPYDTKPMHMPSMKLFKDLRQHVTMPKRPKMLRPVTGA